MSSLALLIIKNLSCTDQEKHKEIMDLVAALNQANDDSQITNAIRERI